jgi:hypothetical protein
MHHPFRLVALSSEAFDALRARSDTELRGRGIRRMHVDEKPGFPCRVSLADAEAMMVSAEVAEGRDLEAHIERAFSDPRVEYLHLHNVRPGCYNCRVDRARV